MSGMIEFKLIKDIKDKFLIIGGEADFGESWTVTHNLTDGPAWAPAHVIVTNGVLHMDICDVINFDAVAGSSMCSYQQYSGTLCYSSEAANTRSYCIKASNNSPYLGCWGVGEKLEGNSNSFAFNEGVGAVFVLEGNVTVNDTLYEATSDLDSYHLIEFTPGDIASYSGTGVIAILWKHPAGVSVDEYSHPLVTPLLRGEPYTE